MTSDDPEFDSIILSHLKQEGFDATYIPFKGNVKAYKNELAHLPDDLELGESFAILGTDIPGMACCSAATDHLQPTEMPQRYA